MSGSLATINIKFAADLQEFSTQMQSAVRELNSYGKQLEKKGKQFTTYLTAPLVALAGVSSQISGDFEQEMAKVLAVSGATGDEFQSLEKNALDLGSATRFTASEVAGLQLSLSKLGFNTSEILDATEATLALAQATGEDLANSATVVASTIKGFGLTAKSTQKVVDVMASSFSSSALDLEKFSVAMSTVAPVAKSAGYNIEQTTGMLAVLIDAGLDASTAGTGLRNIFLDLAVSGQSLTDAMAQISTSANKNATALDLFGKRGATVATVLADNQTASEALITSFYNAGGAAKNMASIMDDTQQGSLAKMKSALEGVAIIIGDKLSPYIIKFADFVSELASSFKELSDGTQNFILVVSGLVAALGPLLVTTGFLMTTVIPGLITAFGYLRAAFIAIQAVMLANPWIALATAIAAVTYAIYTNRKETEKTISTLSTLEQARKDALKSTLQEKIQLKELINTARAEYLSKEKRLAAIKKLKQIAPSYFGDLTLENVKQDNVTTAVNNYIAALNRKAIAQAIQGKKEKLYAQIIEEEQKSTDEAVSKSIDEYSKQFKTQNTLTEEQIKNFTLLAKTGQDFSKKEIERIQGEITELDKYIDKYGELKEVKTVNTNPTGGSSGVVTSLAPSTGLSPTNNIVEPDNLETGLILPDVEPYAEYLDDMQAITDDFNSGFSAAWQDAGISFIEGFGTILGGLASGTTSFSDIGNLFLTTIADMAIRVGKMAISIGLAVSGIKKALTSLNPAAAIGAGIALVALGSLVKGSLSSVASGGSVGPNLADLALPDSAQYTPITSRNNVVAPVAETGFVAETKLSGQDIAIVVSRVNKSNSRVG